MYNISYTEKFKQKHIVADTRIKEEIIGLLAHMATNLIIVAGIMLLLVMVYQMGVSEGAKAVLL